MKDAVAKLEILFEARLLAVYQAQTQDQPCFSSLIDSSGNVSDVAKDKDSKVPSS